VPSRFLARARYVLGSQREVLRASRALRRAADEAETASAAVDAAFEIHIGATAVKPTQVPGEIAEFLELVRAERPQRVLEIGTDNGGTLYLLAWASAPDARILSIDIRAYGRLRRQLYRSFGRRRQHLEVDRRDSHLTATRAAVQRFFRGQPLDVLLIDGDHSYEGVRRDFELYAPLVRTGGIVAFHDIVDGPDGAVGGVPRFWREARSSLVDPVEIVHSRDQGGYGIGVGRWPETPRGPAAGGAAT
jgi:predicted O-methyltransferase YrrM